jgi:hypothetical protein
MVGRGTFSEYFIQNKKNIQSLDKVRNGMELVAISSKIGHDFVTQWDQLEEDQKYRVKLGVSILVEDLDSIDDLLGTFTKITLRQGDTLE